MTIQPRRALVGVAILVVITVVVAIMLLRDIAINRRRQLSTIADITTVAIALQNYADEHDGAFPPVPDLTIPGTLKAQNYKTRSSWVQPPAWPVTQKQLVSALEQYLVPKYLKSLRKIDAWGHPLLCGISSDRRAFVVVSVGRDGKIDAIHADNWNWKEFDRDIVYTEEGLASAPYGVTR